MNHTYNTMKSINTINNKYIDFNFRHDNELLCIKSAMGTGKT